MATREELIGALTKAHSAGDKQNADIFANMIREMDAAGAPENQSSPESPESYANAAAGGLIDGASFGYADEGFGAIAGGLNVLKGGDYQSAYESKRDETRRKLARGGEEHPVLKTAAEIAGALLPAVLTVGQSAPATIGALARTGAKYGAAYGGIAGFGSGEGGLENRAIGSGIGAGFGAAFGAALPVGFAGLRKSAGGLASYIGGNVAGERAGATALGNALSRSGMTMDDVASRLQEAHNLNVPLLPADLSPTMQRLGRMAQSLPGKGSETMARTLSERQMDQGARVTERLRNTFKTNETAFEIVDALKTQRAIEAQPLYEAAFPTKVPVSPKLKELFQRPSIKAAAKKAQQIATEHGDDESAKRLLSFARGKDQSSILTVKEIDYIKRGVDDMLEPARNKFTGKLEPDQFQQGAIKTRAEMLKEVGILVPEYGKARFAFAGPSEMIDAVHLGQSFIKSNNKNEDLVRKIFANMTPTEQDMFRAGGVDTLAKQIIDAGDGVYARELVFGSKGKRDRMKMLFKDEGEYEKFAKAMGFEKMTSDTSRAVRNVSQTSSILADQEDNFLNGVIEVGKAAATGGKSALMSLITEGHAARRLSGINEKSAEIIADFLTNPNPTANLSSKSSAAIMKKIARDAKFRQSVLKASAVTGSTSGRVAAQKEQVK